MGKRVSEEWAKYKVVVYDERLPERERTTPDKYEHLNLEDKVK